MRFDFISAHLFARAGPVDFSRAESIDKPASPPPIRRHHLGGHGLAGHARIMIIFSLPLFSRFLRFFSLAAYRSAVYPPIARSSWISMPGFDCLFPLTRLECPRHFLRFVGLDDRKTILSSLFFCEPARRFPITGCLDINPLAARSSSLELPSTGSHPSFLRSHFRLQPSEL